MLTVNIATYRLHNQKLEATTCQTPQEVVSWLGAVQAQEYAYAKWALSLRLPKASDADIEQAFTTGDILRTHLMRPTWHFVAPADIRWMLTLTAPRVHAANAYMYRKLELNDAVFRQSNTVIIEALQGGKQLTRPELASALAHAGIVAEGLRLSYLMMNAELEGFICNGSRTGKQFTYMLLDERVPPANMLRREEALAELTRRFFTSHGPTTHHDFAWWSGLTINEVKTGLALAKDYLEQEEIDGKPYWFAPSNPVSRIESPTALLLPPYDEYTIAYKDHSAILDPQIAQKVIDAANTLPGIVIIDGQGVGNWRRTINKGAVHIVSTFSRQLSVLEQDAFVAAAHCFGEFVGLPVQLA